MDGPLTVSWAAPVSMIWPPKVSRSTMARKAAGRSRLRCGRPVTEPDVLLAERGLAGPLTRPYACRVPDDQGLAHVISGRQRHHLLVGSAIAFGAAVVVWIFGIALGRGSLLFCAGAASTLALFYLYGTVGSARTYTRFGTAGVRTRSLWGWTDEYPWDQIANVAVQQVRFPNNYRTSVASFVVTTTRAGDHVRLGAPVSGSPGDPDFTRQFRQIRQSWQHATGIMGTPETTAPAWSAGTAWLGAAFGVQVLALVVIFAAVPYFAPAWAAHEGAGTPGVFTSGIRNCPQRGCSWFGTFATAQSHMKYATPEPGGPVIRTAGDSVPAVDTGRKYVVYPVGGGTAWELPAAGVAVGTGVVLLLLASEVLVPTYRRRARHRRASLPVACPPQADPPASAFADGGGHGPSTRRPIRSRLPVNRLGTTEAPGRWPNRQGGPTNRRARKPHA
jgi:hypothetical protein